MTSWKSTTAFWAAWAVLLGPAQYGSGGQMAMPAAQGQEATVRAPGRIVRAIPDPATGTCWLLVREENNPGGPGRLVPVGSREPACRTAAGAPASRRARAVTRTGAPVIRAGERIVVEEKTPVLEARLEAVALEPGWLGEVMRVRLAIGGKWLHALVLGPERARLLPPKGIWQ